ncbi:succinate dehydrogenase cytochrome b558 subunit [Saccharibacillus sp. CPCC 101409]|uniref:succinate dehydrogenase cytochrome b558 subunit n=1 Tax=Saccharibacillus sp. CPCC 101409 TaxID=3058041 RepID=UPI002673EBB6|nr:succinate dehydrogenase cytochrome b558 subunit [Saccharibacillus sp. CPCC 101409]MDO3411045.1 succinate dehydrogenase cytochrome b558 subunit [Saccharibacillus sp. CPCC 101409]
MKGYYARKVHSLLGLIPLSLFIIEHAITNYAAFDGGQEGFRNSVRTLNDLPLVFFLELFGIWLPLLFHGVYGLYIAYQAQPNVGHFSTERNWRYVLQRVTGVIAFIFIIWHVYTTRFQVTLGNVTHDELGTWMHDIVTNPGFFTFFLVGVIATTFHFSNGVWAFLVSWGITVGPRAQRISSYICMGLFVIVTALFMLSLFAFRGEEFASTASIVTSLKTLIG